MLASSQVVEAAGCTYRQLDYWTRNGVIAPSLAPGIGSGSPRRWSDTDLLLIRITARLNLLGANADVLGQVVANLKKRGATALAGADHVVVVPTADHLGVRRVILDGHADGEAAWVVPVH